MGFGQQVLGSCLGFNKEHRGVLRRGREQENQQEDQQDHILLPFSPAAGP